MSKQQPAVRYRYRDPGDGRFITGVPRRDLTESDLRRIDAGALRQAVATGLYTEVDQAALAARQAEAERKAAEEAAKKAERKTEAKASGKEQDAPKDGDQ